MADNCKRCNKDFVESDVVARCVDCRHSFHNTCTRAGSTQSFTKSRNKTLKCDSCVEEYKSNASVRSSEDLEDKNSILKAIRALKIDKEGKFNVGDLQQRLHDTEQHSRSANLEIVGLPKTDNECIVDCLQHIAGALGFEFRMEDISIAHRLRAYSSRRHVHPPIIVPFVSRRVKEDWLRAARTKKNLNAADIHPSLTQSNVYVNDHLIRHNKATFAGFFNGKVIVKAAECAEAVCVTMMEDLGRFNN
ncbi:hypothetical protein J6590_097914 [Homalodisca vitripennis]|nr:hypothetical protein J6590_100050 [Homalodisca vitripennis]KAG8334076.1 hypothetical protein J6590_097914 [Homalodisca vitripennis]